MGLNINRSINSTDAPQIEGSPKGKAVGSAQYESLPKPMMPDYSTLEDRLTRLEARLDALVAQGQKNV